MKFKVSIKRINEYICSYGMEFIQEAIKKGKIQKEKRSIIIDLETIGELLDSFLKTPYSLVDYSDAVNTATILLILYDKVHIDSKSSTETAYEYYVKKIESQFGKYFAANVDPIKVLKFFSEELQRSPYRIQ